MSILAPDRDSTLHPPSGDRGGTSAEQSRHSATKGRRCAYPIVSPSGPTRIPVTLDRQPETVASSP